MKFYKSVWVQQVAAWITIISVVYFILNKAFNLMLSQPTLFLICISSGVILSSLLFSAHAYFKVSKVIKDNNTIINRLNTIEDKISSFQNSNSVIKQETNDPAFFPALNESALKKHIALTASHCHYENVIDKIFLFEGTPNKYQIIVIGKDTKDFGKMKQYWDTK